MSPPASSGQARDVGVIIVAAGSSTRTRETGTGTRTSAQHELKQFRWVAGKPMLLHSLQSFMSRADVACVVCVIPQNYVADPPPWIFQCDVDRLLLSVGGKTRADSVRNGLEDLPDEARVVLVHDAARPLVDDAVVDRVVAKARAGDCVVPGLAVADTIKEVEAGGGEHVRKTLDRSLLRRVQTPQGFPRDVITRAHREGREHAASATDDATLVERLGIDVVVVEGSERTMKVTTEADFERIEALFAAR